jgi:putative SOS response-associated peptidase YedK
MCGRFFLSTSGAEIARHFGLRAAPDLAPHWNVAPGQAIAAVRTAGKERVLELRRWGLVPPWAKDPKLGSRMINARAETLAVRPAFQDALARRRALVPADGFYEWQRRGRHSQPFAIRVRGGLFAMAGLYERWTGPEGERVETCLVVTTDANERVRRIHGRMPAILAPGDYAAWLDPGQRDPRLAAALLRPCPDDWIELRPVSPRVNDPRVDDPSLLEPWREPPGLFGA